MPWCWCQPCLVVLANSRVPFSFLPTPPQHPHPNKKERRHFTDGKKTCNIEGSLGRLEFLKARGKILRVDRAEFLMFGHGKRPKKNQHLFLFVFTLLTRLHFLCPQKRNPRQLLKRIEHRSRIHANLLEKVLGGGSGCFRATPGPHQGPYGDILTSFQPI